MIGLPPQNYRDPTWSNKSNLRSEQFCRSVVYRRGAGRWPRQLLRLFLSHQRCFFIYDQTIALAAALAARDSFAQA
jgi:hypothetical protein